MCNAKITINDQVYTCECEDDMHTGPHCCRTYSKGSVIDGIAWDIGEDGQVILSMPSYVAEVMFASYLRPNPRPGERGSIENPYDEHEIPF